MLNIYAPDRVLAQTQRLPCHWHHRTVSVPVGSKGLAMEMLSSNQLFNFTRMMRCLVLPLLCDILRVSPPCVSTTCAVRLKGKLPLVS